MVELTFVIPCAPYHRSVLDRAVQSVKKQTLDCEIVIIEDSAGRGAGWARNQGLQQVITPFVSFLDADDMVAPKFAEIGLFTWKPEKYVYTDWYVRGQHYKAPPPCNLWTTRHYKERPADIPAAELQYENGEWLHKTYHLITTIIPTEIVHRIGGFDEELPGAEDTDFGIRLRLAGICGVHVKEPLLTYSGDGLRSQNLNKDAAAATITANYLKTRYGEYIYMGCCGDNEAIPANPGNAKQDGDILVMPAWTGNRPIYGAATGRFYGARIGGNKPLWMHPADFLAMQTLFRKAEVRQNTGAQVVLAPRYQTNGAPPPSQDWRRAGDAVFGGGQPVQPAQQTAQEWEYKPVENTRTLSDKLKLVQRKTGE